MSGYFLKYYQKFSEILLKILRNYTRNLLKWFFNSQNFMIYFSKFYEMIIENFRHNSRNFRKYFSRFYKKIIEILNNNSSNFQKFLLKIFKLFFFNFANIFRDFPKYFSEGSYFLWRLSEIIFKILEITVILKNFGNNSQKFYEIFFENFRRIS